MNTLRWSTTELNVSICEPGGVSLSARWPFGVDVLSLINMLLRHSLRKCPIFPHLKHALHSFEAWLSPLQCLQGHLELLLLSSGGLEFVIWRLDPRQLLSRLLVFRPPFEFFWNRTVRVFWESMLFDRKGWLLFGVLLRCRDPSWLGLGMAFLNPSISVRTSSSIHSLAHCVGGNGFLQADYEYSIDAVRKRTRAEKRLGFHVCGLGRNRRE